MKAILPDVGESVAVSGQGTVSSNRVWVETLSEVWRSVANNSDVAANFGEVMIELQKNSIGMLEALMSRLEAIKGEK